jgi:hypothetical protein
MSAKAVIAVLIAVALSTSSSDAQNYTSVAYAYAKIAFPGAALTIANAINDNNVIVGSFFDTNSSVHGFVYWKGNYEQVDYPGSSETEVLGINDNADIVGVYQIVGPLNFHGFLRHNGQFTSLDVPQAEFGTKVFGINRDMTMVGSFDDSQGFILKRGAFTVFNAPQLPGEGFQTQLNGINNNGWSSGQVFSGGAWRGFWFREQDIDFLQPLGSSDNQVTGMNRRGDIVGCHDATSGFVSFEVEPSKNKQEEKEPLQPQQKLASCASGINYARVVVGNYFQVNQIAAFVGVPQMTLRVHGTVDQSSITGPVRLSAMASGLHPVRQIQIWSNYHKIMTVKGAFLNTRLPLPKGLNRVVIVAVDSKNKTAKVALRLTVR